DTPCDRHHGCGPQADRGVHLLRGDEHGVPDHGMGAVMSKPEELDEVTGLSLADMAAAAEDLYVHRDQAAGDEVPSEPATEIRSVVSVRFNRGELDGIAAAASAAGLPVSTYIRNAALAPPAGSGG